MKGRLDTGYDSVLFKNKNEGKFVKENIEIEDCEGNKECIEVCKPYPFEYEAPMGRPKFFAYTFGSDTHYSSPIMEKPYAKKGMIVLHIRFSLNVGDIVLFWKNKKIENCPKFYIKKKERGYDKFGNTIVYLKRIDEEFVTPIDMEIAKKATELVVVDKFESKN